MEILLILCLGISFLVTYLLTPLWIRAAYRIKLVGKDMNKFEHREVAEMGGVAVIAGFLTGVLCYIGVSTFYLHSTKFLIFILATVSTVLIITIVGILDDILGWKIGFKQWHKPLLTLTAALPIMVVNAGESSMALPILGSIDFGIVYPLIIVPIAIMGASNGFNMLAGYNGLEAGMGIIILSALGYVAWATGSGWVAMLAFTIVFALIAFLIYNWYPAKVFPGDSLTYSIGALIATVAILGNIEKIAVILFLLYYAEFLIKAKNKFKGECFGRVREDETIAPPETGIESLTHLIMKLGRFREDKIVLILLGIQITIALLAILFIKVV